MRKLRGAAESLQLQEHFSPGGVGDTTHSSSTGEGAGRWSSQGRGEEVSERPGTLRTVGARFLYLDKARRSSARLLSNLVSERVFDDDDESLSFSLSP